MKRFINLVLLIAGIAFLSQVYDAAMGRVDSMTQAASNIAQR